MKFDVRDTFEMFWKEPLSVLTKGLFSLVNINTTAYQEKSVNVETNEGKTQITVVNNERLYKMLQDVINKKGIE